MNLIDGEIVIEEIARRDTTDGTVKVFSGREVIDILKSFQSIQSDTCRGCKHIGKWDNEIEYGCSSPCTRCKRRMNDNYER